MNYRAAVTASEIFLSNYPTSIYKEEAGYILEFASSIDNLEEIFENREQIEISRFYERLPKPVAIAIEDLLKDKIYIRKEDLIS
ncbi:hypothetical protein ANCCEY_15444 [Ancylostoma ceylanicum]|uniref:Uncharacterized protein n=1 Tax=Ancylostoma ceylanicum TaxID=53326 RepID=A0A0D6LCL4_9BILA|nr:hypothetical protein ANCCEY_15444 [Ancylostoma ceylanicum]